MGKLYYILFTNFVGWFGFDVDSLVAPECEPMRSPFAIKEYEFTNKERKIRLVHPTKTGIFS